VSLVGLDIGTTGTKAVAFDREGKVLATAYQEYDMRSPEPGQLELDPEEVLGAVRKVLTEIAAQTKNDPPESLGWSALGEAAVPVDSRGKPLAPAIIGFDCRGEEQARWLRERISDQEVFALTGHGINSFHTICKILWRRDSDPRLFRQTAKWLCFPDFFLASLGLEPAIDYSLAARTLLLDIHKGQWSEKLLELSGLEPENLARPVPPGEPVGEIGPNDFGFPPSCVIGAGLHDQPAGILGVGTGPGEAMYAIGTVVCLGVRLTARPDPGVMLRNNLCAYPTYGHGQLVSLAWNFTGGSLLKWYRDQFAYPEKEIAEKEGKDVYDLICSRIPERPASLLILPYFTTTGTPYLDPRARGAIFGLHLTTRREELARAILEAVNYDIALNTELLREAGVEISLYKAIGGAARSDVWMQIVADILGKPVVTLRATEGASWGAALMGAKAAGIVTDPEELARQVAQPKKRYEPRKEYKEAYRRRFALYRELYERNRDILHALSDLAQEGK